MSGFCTMLLLLNKLIPIMWLVESQMAVVKLRANLPKLAFEYLF